MRVAAAVVVFLLASSAAAGVDDLFSAGETLDYNLSWSRIAGGTARMTIAPLDEQRYRISSIAQSNRGFSKIFRFRDELESVVTRDSFSTLRYRKLLDERGRTKDEVTEIDTATGIATRKGKSISVPNPIFDPVSLMYYLRRFDLSPGKTHEFTVLTDGKIYTLQAAVLSREQITTPAGTFRTVLVEPKMLTGGRAARDDRRLLIWYSDDEKRLPVRIRSHVSVGAITATLRAVQSGVETAGATSPGN